MKKTDGKMSAKGKAWLGRELRPFRPFVLFLTALTVLATLLSLAFAYLTRYLVNGASDKDLKRLVLFSSLLVALLFSRILLQTAVNYLSEQGRAKIAVGLRQKLFLKVLRGDYERLEKYHSGDLLNRLTSDVAEVASDTISILPAAAGMIVQCVGAVTALLTLDPLFTAIFVAGGLAVSGLTALFRRRMKRYHKELLEADGKSRSFMQESVVSSLTLKAYGAEERTAEKSREILDGYYRKRMRQNKLRVGMGGLFSLLSNVGFIFAVIWCGVGIMRGTTDYGSILSIILLLGQLQQPFAAFSAVLPVCYARAASGERLCELDEMPAEQETLADTADVYASLKSLKAEDVIFDYDGRERLFAGASAEIEKGEIVCITGGSGSGKSTLFKLLLSVYTPQSGGLSLVCARRNGGKEETYTRPLTARERGLFAYVPQGNFLFSGSIKENLLFFAPEAEREKQDEKISAALKTACAEFVFELPEGLETPLRERGGGLSEGQLQRLAVARALLSERPILLLDEATSALDGETEKRLLENIRGEAGKTCLIVTHRPAALEIADQVLRVQNGRIETV